MEEVMDIFNSAKVKIAIIAIILFVIGLPMYSFAEHSKGDFLTRVEQNNWKIFTGWRKALYVLDLNGKCASVFKESYYRINDFSLSPNGKKIVFCETGGPDESFREYLTIANIDGSDRERLLEIRVDVQGIKYLAWSPASEQEIAFLSDYKYGNESCSLYLFNIKNKSKQIIVKDLVSALGIPVFSWSPDGRRIAFTSTDGKIMVVNKDGSNLEQVCDDKGTVPSWSPDGTVIAYRQGENYVKNLSDGSSEYGDTGSGEYYIIDIDTKNKKQIFKNKWLGILPLDIFTQPVWSPDGQYILLYKMYDKLKRTGGVYQIYWIIDIDKANVIHSFESDLAPTANVSWIKVGN